MLLAPFGGFPFGSYGFSAPPVQTAAVADDATLRDGVVLCEISATAGPPTETGGPLVFGSMPFGTFPGGVFGANIELRFSDRDWTSLPTDPLPNTHWEGRLNRPRLERTLPLRPDSDRRVVFGVGSVDVDNADGYFDSLPNTMTVEGGAFQMSYLPSRSAASSQSFPLFSGQGVSWQTDASNKLRLVARDSSYLLEVPMLGLYGGTGGEDGTARVAGEPIVEVWGRVRTMRPQLIDEGRHIYRVHARLATAINQVYDRGALVTAGSQRVSWASLVATSPTPGTWDSLLTPTGSYIRLGTPPTGVVTADVDGENVSGTFAQTAGAIIRRICERFSAQIDAPSFALLDTVAPGTVGHVFERQTTVAEAVSQVAAGAFAWWGDVLGRGLVSAGRLGPPAFTPSIMFDESSIFGEVTEMDPLPAFWRVRVLYRRNWTELRPADIVTVPTITESRRDELTKEGAWAVASQPPRRASHPLMGELEIRSAFDNASDAQNTAESLLAFHAPYVRGYRIPVGVSGYGVRLGSTIRVTWPKKGLEGGKNLVVVGQIIEGPNVILQAYG